MTFWYLLGGDFFYSVYTNTSIHSEIVYQGMYSQLSNDYMH